MLNQLLDEHGDADWATVFAEFQAQRKPNADAMADLALYNFIEMRDRVADPRFLLQKKIEAKIAGPVSGPLDAALLAGHVFAHALRRSLGRRPAPGRHHGPPHAPHSDRGRLRPARRAGPGAAGNGSEAAEAGHAAASAVRKPEATSDARSGE